MHIGKSYKLSEFLIWTKRNIYLLMLLGIVPVVLYKIAGLTWLAIPWTVVALLGTATAFIVGFKNAQSYSRALDAQQTWIVIANNSKTWGTISRDYLNNNAKSTELIYRHFAWLTALRYQMRESRIWETTNKAHNVKYKRYYRVEEKENSMENELVKYLSADELKFVLATHNPATQILSLQGKAVKELYAANEMPINFFLELEKTIAVFFDLQGKSERIKDFPYPRQYSTINRFFIHLFCLLLPFGMLKEFDKLNENVGGVMHGHMVWLVIPFSVIISWMYTSLEQVGESSENPFEGGANDVPISQISRGIEIDLREMLGEKDLPACLQEKNNIIL